MIKEFLQGKPLGHPLHPILVHIPIAAFLLSFILDVCDRGSGTTGVRTNTVLADMAMYLMGLGVAGALLAAVPGLADYSTIRHDHPAKSVARMHLWVNVGVIVLYAINFLLRWRSRDHLGDPVVSFLMSLVGIGALSFSGYLGGVLVYDDGIGVGRHRRIRGKTPEETLVPPAAAVGADGYATVARADWMEDRQTLRVDLGGTVVCVAKVDGEYYAFQEFCTHRAGPLSEGCFKDGTVMCPWHRSQFHLRDGTVAAGPARVPLKVFDVRVRDGNVVVRATPVGGRAQDVRPTAPEVPVSELRPGQVAPAASDWKAAEAEERRRRMEPRVDPDGKTQE
jgi:nitrite reductase/ring-hydroxylating ferredoxin subunit/uncharacterized membrane protein